MHDVSIVAEIVSGVVALLLIAAAILALTKKLHLPFTVALVLVGISLSWLSQHYPDNLQMIRMMEISPDLILYVFLPTLIFESTFNLDTRALRHNLGPILTLAVPGLLLSTALIGVIVWLATPIPLAPALLLGAILSATDPVAVVSLFKQLGAPERLTVLVEGESLFNDATSIVVARILVGVIAAGVVSGETITSGIIDFFILFVGGLLLGVVLGLIVAVILGWVESDPFIEISLTTALAYLSFLMGEELFHVSGVMATVGAGLTLGSWGRVKISASVRHYLESFWEYLAFIANALIFLMVGLAVNPAALWGSIDLLVWVLLGMLVARAVIVFGLMPLVGRLPGSKPVNLAYQTVMYWGGLRGAIALAIVLSLPAFEYSEVFVALVTGAVLFTLLLQGLSIEALMHRLRLDQPPIADRLALLECDLNASKGMADRVPELQSGGLFSAKIARRLLQQSRHDQVKVQNSIEKLRREEMSHKEELNLLYLRAFSRERTLYTQMHAKGHLSEGAYRELALVLTLQIDAIRHHGAFAHVHSHRIRRVLERLLYALLDRAPLLTPISERMRMARLIRNYETSWGHYQGSRHALEYLRELASMESIPQQLVAEIRARYEHWHDLAKGQLDQMSEQFPELVLSMQNRLGQRIELLAKSRSVEEQAERGLLPRGVAEKLQSELALRLSSLRGESTAKLRDDPGELLAKVPLFKQLPREDFHSLTSLLRPITLEAGEPIIRQGELGDGLFVIARGVVRVSREESGTTINLGTLMAGDFFGEMALMQHESRNASVYAVTPCRLYTLTRAALEEVIARNPSVDTILRRTDEERRREMA